MSLLSPHTKCPWGSTGRKGWGPRKVKYIKLSSLLALMLYKALSLSFLSQLYHLIKCFIPGTHLSRIVILTSPASKAALYWISTVLIVTVLRAVTACISTLLANSENKHYLLSPHSFYRRESWVLDRWSHFPNLPHPNGSHITCTSICLVPSLLWASPKGTAKSCFDPLFKRDSVNSLNKKEFIFNFRLTHRTLY